MTFSAISQAKTNKDSLNYLQKADGHYDIATENVTKLANYIKELKGYKAKVEQKNAKIQALKKALEEERKYAEIAIKSKDKVIKLQDKQLQLKNDKIRMKDKQITSLKMALDEAKGGLLASKLSDGEEIVAVIALLGIALK